MSDKLSSACVTCSASLACVAGVARFAFRCCLCDKIVVQMKAGITKNINTGRTVWPMECKLKMVAVGWTKSWTCMPCRTKRHKVGLR